MTKMITIKLWVIKICTAFMILGLKDSCKSRELIKRSNHWAQVLLPGKRKWKTKNRQFQRQLVVICHQTSTQHKMLKPLILKIWNQISTCSHIEFSPKYIKLWPLRREQWSIDRVYRLKEPLLEEVVPLKAEEILSLNKSICNLVLIIKVAFKEATS